MKKERIRTELIYIFIKTSNISKTKFCKQCKISPSTLKKIMNGELPKNKLTVWKIADRMGLRLHQMYEL